jgi:hypothetical protein
VPTRLRRPIIRRPGGTILILGATAGVAYKLGQEQAQQIQEYTGYPPEQLSEEDLQAAMTDLNIQSEPLDDADRQEIKAAQAGGTPAASQPAGGQDDYIEELRKLAELRDEGIITDDEFETKKQQLLGKRD